MFEIMATKVLQGDDNAYTVNTELSLSREQIQAVSDLYNREQQFTVVQNEMKKQLTAAGYNIDTVNNIISDTALVSTASSLYSSYKMQLDDYRLVNAVQQILLDNDIIRIIEPESAQNENSSQKSDDRKTNRKSKHREPDDWSDTIYD